MSSILSYGLIKTSMREATRESPFHLVYGVATVIPAEVGIESHRLLHFKEGRNEELVSKNLVVEEEREIAHLRAEKYKSRMKAAYNRKVALRKFEVGDWSFKRLMI